MKNSVTFRDHRKKVLPPLPMFEVEDEDLVLELKYGSRRLPTADEQLGPFVGDDWEYMLNRP